jgi:hypothetical protein
MAGKFLQSLQVGSIRFIASAAYRARRRRLPRPVDWKAVPGSSGSRR